MVIEIESSSRVNTAARRTPELVVSMYLDYMYKRSVLGLSTLVLCDAFSFIARQLLWRIFVVSASPLCLATSQMKIEWQLVIAGGLSQPHLAVRFSFDCTTIFCCASIKIKSLI